MSRAAKIRWRKVDTTETEQCIEDAQKERRIASKLDAGPLFEIVKEPASLSRRMMRELGIFDSKNTPATTFESLRPQKRRQIEKVLKGLDASRQVRAKRRQERQEEKSVFDAWDDEMPSPLKKMATPFKRPTETLTPPTCVPALKLPHPGQSYNADPEDLAAAIFEATDAEVAAEEKKQKKLEEELEGVILMKNAIPKSDQVESEASQSEEEEGTKEKMKKPKTKRTRKAATQHKILLASHKHASLTKKLLRSIEQLPQISSQVDKEMKKKELRLLELIELKKARKRAESKGIVGKVKIGRSSFVDRPIEVLPREDIAGNLRSMKIPDSTAVIHDRMASAKRRRLAVGKSPRQN